MITFDSAREIVMNSAFDTGVESAVLHSSLDRILREDIISDTDMPPFNKSTVDGFACRRQDLENGLDLIETIYAGSPPERKIGENQCSKIMTGAEVPEGADMVFMVEDAVVLPSGKVTFGGSFSGDNITMRGEEVRSGDVILTAARIIRPQEIALFALAGYTRVRVARRPLVTIISSGNELVDPEEKPGMSQIRNSNSYQLMAQVESSGAEGHYLGIARDDEDNTLDLLRKALGNSDVILISGGVSMGDFDFVPTVFERAGVKIHFTRIQIQPGKTTIFGTHESTLVFGLPGNPVSSFIQFEILVKPLLYKMMGFNYMESRIMLPMGTGFARKSADKKAMIPVYINDEGFVMPVEYPGTAHLAAFSAATGLIAIPEGTAVLQKGDIVNVRPV